MDLGRARDSLFLVFVVLIAPVFIVPIFNKVTPLNDPKVTEPMLRLAHANGIPANDVYQMDASRQTTRMSANVCGFGNTMRITLNDNLLRRGSPEEIQAVMGHEMGHYVLNHVYKGIIFFLRRHRGRVRAAALGARLVRWRDGARSGRSAASAIRPCCRSSLLLIIDLLLRPDAGPQHITRTQEHEADMYGINASRQPDGFAQAAIHLGEYRKMSPGPVEEWIFFDHPSGRNRIHAAMGWKGENLKSVRRAARQPRIERRTKAKGTCTRTEKSREELGARRRAVQH